MVPSNHHVQLAAKRGRDDRRAGAGCRTSLQLADHGICGLTDKGQQPEPHL